MARTGRKNFLELSEDYFDGSFYFLKKKGYKILHQNFYAKYGEIDLVAEDKEYLVFVEVKLRKSDSFANAFEYVDARKQERIRTTASVYLSEVSTTLQPRFDVIEIYAPQGTATAEPEIYHLEDAFQ